MKYKVMFNKINLCGEYVKIDNQTAEILTRCNKIKDVKKIITSNKNIEIKVYFIGKNVLVSILCFTYTSNSIFPTFKQSNYLSSWILENRIFN